MTTEMTADPMVRVREVTRTYGGGRAARRPVPALRGVSFDVRTGRLVAVRGRSGAGKTTLLNIVGGLDRPDGGRVTVAGDDVTGMSGAELHRMRRETVGFVFQSFGLIPMLTAAENVGVPMRLARLDPGRREERARHLLGLVGLEKHADQRANELSGGQQQRVAIARALANSPRLLIADEPTGQLDSATGAHIMTLLRDLVDHQGITALIATHDPTLLALADHTLHLSDGTMAG